MQSPPWGSRTDLDVNAAHQIPVNVLSDKGYHGSRRLANSHQCSVKGHVGIDLILLHALGPETLPAAAHIPVAHVIHKLLKRPGCLWNPVIGKIIIHLAHNGIQLGEQPFIHDI